MIVAARERPGSEEFAEFFRVVEPRLRAAMVACYGPVYGREAAGDALSWAWQNWDRLRAIDNKVGYLYRVGQSAAHGNAARASRVGGAIAADDHVPEIEPGLVPALTKLSEQQRTVVVLVHGFGWTQTDVAELLDVNVSTVREHLSRALIRLRTALGVSHAG
jgi:DNA-directed RNA polymerase specialized sigma24 family protein